MKIKLRLLWNISPCFQHISWKQGIIYQYETPVIIIQYKINETEVLLSKVFIKRLVTYWSKSSILTKKNNASLRSFEKKMKKTILGQLKKRWMACKKWGWVDPLYRWKRLQVISAPSWDRLCIFYNTSDHNGRIRNTNKYYI